ncbi:29466_t:CDS:1, partial [Racocetra persica]
MTQYPKTQDIDITSSTPQSSRPNDTDSPPNLTDTPPNITNSPPNVTDTPINVQDVQDSQPPPYDQVVLQTPNVQESPQNIHATPQIVQPLQPHFQPNINSTYPYTSQYFSQPYQPYQPPIISNDNNTISNNSGSTNNPSTPRRVIISIRTFISMVFILVSMILIRYFSYLSHWYYIILLIALLSVIFHIMRLINAHNHGEFFMRHIFNYEVTRLRLLWSVLSFLAYLIMSIAIIKNIGIISQFSVLSIVNLCIFALTILWALSTSLMYIEYRQNRYNNRSVDTSMMTTGYGNNVVANRQQNDPVTNGYVISSVNSYGQNEYYVF